MCRSFCIPLGFYSEWHGKVVKSRGITWFDSHISERLWLLCGEQYDRNSWDQRGSSGVVRTAGFWVGRGRGNRIIWLLRETRTDSRMEVCFAEMWDDLKEQLRVWISRNLPLECDSWDSKWRCQVDSWLMIMKAQNYWVSHHFGSHINTKLVIIIKGLSVNREAKRSMCWNKELPNMKNWLVHRKKPFQGHSITTKCTSCWWVELWIGC